MNLDIIPNGAIKRVHVSQNDVGRTLTFELFNGSVQYDVPVGATVKIQGTKPSGFGFSETCTVSGNVVTVDTTEEMTDEYGYIDTELQIKYNGNTIGTSNFVLAVEKNPHPDTTTDGSMDTIIPELTLLVDEVKGYAEEIEDTYHAYGSPWVASTVAEMTDTSKIYVYTGSETGYTNGNWYYYNGSAWVSGGVYNSLAVQTDTTLTQSGVPADAKVTGYFLDFSYNKYVPVEQGYWAIANGTATNSNTWCRTSFFLPKNLIIKSDYLMYLLAYDINGDYVGTWNGSDWSTTYVADSYFKDINIKNWVELYPNYRFKIDFSGSGAETTPTNVYSSLTVEDVNDKRYDELERHAVETYIGEEFTPTVSDVTGNRYVDFSITAGHQYRITNNFSKLTAFYTSNGVWTVDTIGDVGVGLSAVFTATNDAPNIKFYNEANTTGSFRIEDLYGKIEEVEQEIIKDTLSIYSNVFSIEQGYWAIANGSKVDSSNWCRTSDFVPKNLIITSTFGMYLLAYDINGNYIGTWNGSAFSTTFAQEAVANNLNIQEFAKNFNNYKFKIDFYNYGQSCQASDVTDSLTIINALDLYNNVGISDKLMQYASLFNNDSEETDSFIFFTDPHIFPRPLLEAKIKLMLGTIEEFYDNSSANFVLSGGDWLQSSDTQEEACYKLARINGMMRAKFGDNYYPLLGNHDTNYQGVISASDSSRGDLSNEALIGLWFSRFGQMYYSFKTVNTRYYAFDSGIDWVDTMTSYRWTQVDWFATQLLQNDDKHSVIAIHIFSQQPDSEQFDEHPFIPSLAENLTLIAQAYNAKTTITRNGITYDFSQTTGKVAYLIAGHTHYDKITTHNDIPVIITTNASYTPTFDLMYVDYDNSLLSTVRVGTGSNRTMSIVT